MPNMDNGDLEDFDKGFELWDKITTNNTNKVTEGDFIEGHVYYYNFNEMNYPPPYPQAKDTGKFEIW